MTINSNSVATTPGGITAAIAHPPPAHAAMAANLSVLA